jgi:putative PIN family toxin of toxin-antitoxin system
LKARRQDVIALSPAVEAEILGVLARPKFARHLTPEDRTTILALISDAAVRVEPRFTIDDCRDSKDNKYLELAAAVNAGIIISSDRDLLALDPWRGTPVLLPRTYLDMP